MECIFDRMILLTGATGILGMRLAYDLAMQGEDIMLLARPESDKETFIRVLAFYHEGDVSALLKRITWTLGDILDVSTLEEAISQCDQVIHAAAMVSFHPKDAVRMYDTNKRGTAHIVDVCVAQKKRLLYISSVAALGRTVGMKSINEKSTWKDGPMNSNYAISKYNAELEVWRGIEEGLEAVMVNPSVIIGAGPVSRSSGTLFGTVLSGNRFYTDGMATAVDVRDVSRKALWLLNSEQRSERFILHSEQITYGNMFQCMADHLKMKGPTIKAKSWMLAIGWRLAAFKDWIFGTRSKLTKETAMSSENDFDYSTEKIEALMGEGFIPVQEAIAYHAKFYCS